MTHMIITVAYENARGEETVVDIPAVFAVCDDCNGHGTVLCAGMRDHAYSMEEFLEAFEDEEDREEYFRPGGRYDVTCETCKGKRVVKVPDDPGHMNAEQREALAALEKQERERWECDMESAAERRMGA